MAGEWVDGCFVCEAVVGWEDVWTPHAQRADWVKGHVDSDTTVAADNPCLFWVKFRLRFS